MAGKRSATTELNHDNWDDEGEAEEAGTFKRAPEDVLKQRVIKTARRKRPMGGEEGSATKNVFSGFSGFGKTNTQSTTSADTSSPFAFLNSMTKPSTNQNGSSMFSPLTSPSNDTKKSNLMSFKPMSSTSQETKCQTETETKPKENGTSKSTENTKSDDKNTDYYASLKGLNESVANWIKTHVDENPFCILTPIFKDYEKYLAEIESKKDKSESSGNKSSTEVSVSKPTTSISFGISPSTTNVAQEKPSLFNSPKTSASEFSLKPTGSTLFGGASSMQKTEDKSPFAKPSLSFGSTSSLGGPSGFSFGTGAPFQFANVAKPASDDKSDNKPKEDDEDEPPKVEFTRVVEEDNIFEKRCKVFVKKDGNYSDRGIGQLYLKPVAGSEKVQLIVRADTNLGNLLLNFILSESIPLQRMGKNNVMLVCIPTPESKPPPVPILLRVKTAQEADELLKILEQNKK